MKATLDHIFGNLLESSDTCMYAQWRERRAADKTSFAIDKVISITAHSGIASMILRIIGHRSYPLPAGGVVPVVIKVTAT